MAEPPDPDDEDIAHQPHDGLVKRIFTDPKAAAVELRQVLPSVLGGRLDWDRLRVVSASFIDPKLKPRHSDILYSVALHDSDQEISIYVVLEHQSTPRPTMAARFLSYVGRFYERWLRDNDRSPTVPMIVPVLLYQGPDGWTLPRRFSEIIDVPPDLLEVFPSPIELIFPVDDLEDSLLGERVTMDQLIRDRGLAQAEMARTLLWLYAHPEASTGERAATLGVLLDFIARTLGPDAVEPFITYFISAFELRSPLHAILAESVDPEVRHMYTTIREAWLAEGRAEGEARGRAEGRAKGMEEGKARGMARMLERLLDARGLPLHAEQRARIVACDDETVLQRWFDRAVTATTLAEIFAD